jgi:serine/threonine protein kinase
VERREFYQRRLTLFAKIFFLTFVILLIWVNVIFLTPEEISPASDIYAVGATAFFLLTGRVVFPAKASVEMAMNHVKTAPTPPGELVAGVPEGLDQLILDCLASDSADIGGRHLSIRDTP